MKRKVEEKLEKILDATPQPENPSIARKGSRFTYAIAAFTGVVILSLLLYRNSVSSKRVKLYNQVEAQADLNHDGTTSNNEWLEVYKQLDSNPGKPLSYSQMETYLGNNQ